MSEYSGLNFEKIKGHQTGPKVPWTWPGAMKWQNWRRKTHTEGRIRLHHKQPQIWGWCGLVCKQSNRSIRSRPKFPLQIVEAHFWWFSQFRVGANLTRNLRCNRTRPRTGELVPEVLWNQFFFDTSFMSFDWSGRRSVWSQERKRTQHQTLGSTKIFSTNTYKDQRCSR